MRDEFLQDGSTSSYRRPHEELPELPKPTVPSLGWVAPREPRLVPTTPLLNVGAGDHQTVVESVPEAAPLLVTVIELQDSVHDVAKEP